MPTVAECPATRRGGYDSAMNRPIDDILRDLLAVQEELSSTSSDDLTRRIDLLERQKRLRAEAAEVRASVSDDVSVEQLRLQIAHLEAEILHHFEARPSGSMAGGAGGPGGGGIDPDQLHEMHRTMAASFGLDEKQAELQRLKARLDELRGD